MIQIEILNGSQTVNNTEQLANILNAYFPYVIKLHDSD